MFNINDIITKENYTTVAIACNKAGDRHIELVDGKYIIVANNNPTTEEKKQSRISELKQLLSDTDYKAIKYSEGLISEEEYVETKAQRQAWRDEINQLEVTK